MANRRLQLLLVRGDDVGDHRGRLLTSAGGRQVPLVRIGLQQQQQQRHEHRGHAARLCRSCGTPGYTYGTVNSTMRPRSPIKQFPLLSY
jgi:hypothetical protein